MRQVIGRRVPLYVQASWARRSVLGGAAVLVLGACGGSGNDTRAASGGAAGTRTSASGGGATSPAGMGGSESSAAGGGAKTSSGAGGNAAAGSAGRTGEAGTGDERPRVDITASVLGNADITLTGDAVVRVPAGSTTYTGVMSGSGTVKLTPASSDCAASTLIITRESTFTLPENQQVELVTKAGPWPGMGYRLDITGSNPPALTIDPCVTFQIGTNTATDDHPNVIATSDSLNQASVVNAEINLDNIRNDGLLVLNSSQFVLLGEISGSGSVSELPDVWGGHSPRGASSFSGILSLSTGEDFGSDHVGAQIANAKAILNEGSWLVWSPPNSVVRVTQDVYEAAFGGDINFHPIGNSTIVMSGVYGHTDNSPHGSPNLQNPGLSDPSLNLAKVIYRDTMTVNGNDASFRGINIESSGTVQWGDGTHARFFLPSAPSPAEVDPALGKKNAYVNLHRGGTLAFNYNGPVSLNVGITGGGGGPDKSGSPGVGNVTIMSTPGNDVTFAQPQNYNGTTTIESGARLRLGAGTEVPLNYVTLKNGVKTVELIANYDGDSSLLTSESPNGDPSDKIVNDGTLIVQNTTAAITLSHMSGSGTLVQAGSAPVTVLTNTYRGGTQIDHGTLFAGDHDAFGRGDVENGGTLAALPKQDIVVLGSYREKANGVLRLAAFPSHKNQVLRVQGRAELAGTLELVFEPESLVVGQQLTVVKAKGGLSGRFRSVVAKGFELETRELGDTCYVIVRSKQRGMRWISGV